MSDLQYKESGRADILYVYNEDKAFDGEAWSDDGSSFKITVDCGIMKRVDFFDEDGNLFYAFDFNEREELYFNEKGNEITKKQARDIYANKYKHLKEVLLVEFNDILNQRTIESSGDEETAVVKESKDAPSEAEKELMAAELEINKIHEEINARFDKLIIARENLEQANETLARFEHGTNEYNKAQKEKSTLTNEIEECVDIINRNYAKYCGFCITVTQNISLYEAFRDKVKSAIAVEILKKRKQEALDRIHEEYYGY
jgi:hypothetical protein